MKITEDIRQFAREQGVGEYEAIESGLEQMAGEFREKGAELYVETAD